MSRPNFFFFGVLLAMSIGLAACDAYSYSETKATAEARSKTEVFETSDAATWAAATLDAPAPLTLEFKTRTPTPTSTPTATPTITPTPPPTGSQVRGAAPPALSIDLKSSGGPVGSGVLIAQDNQTQVRADVKPNGTNSSMAALIRQGTCQQPGAVKYPLTNLVNNSSQTMIDAGLESLLTGNLVLNVEQAGNRPYACGAIPKGAILTLGPGRDGDQSPAYAVLLAAGKQTQVSLNVGLTEQTVDQPAAIYTGSCANLGGAKYPLGNTRFGALHTTLNAGLDTLLKGDSVIAIAKSTAQPDFFVACGDLK